VITGEGSHQLTANDIGDMGRFDANVIVFVLNNSGYLVERSLEKNPNWTYNDLAPWNYAELPKALGCSDWYTARVTTLGELDEAMKAARASKNVPRQALLIPAVVELEQCDVERIEDARPLLAELGLSVEAFGPGAVAVYELPAL